MGSDGDKLLEPAIYRGPIPFSPPLFERMRLSSKHSFALHNTKQVR
jgi:hypothetical protein